MAVAAEAYAGGPVTAAWSSKTESDAFIGDQRYIGVLRGWRRRKGGVGRNSVVEEDTCHRIYQCPAVLLADIHFAVTQFGCRAVS